MENKKYYYMKLKEDFFDSELMVLLESMQDGIIYSNILMNMYLKSLKNNGKLMLNDFIPYNPQMIATITKHQVGTVEKALDIFQKLGLIEVLTNGAIYMNDIELFIGQSSTEGERKKIARMKLKEENLLSQKTSGGQMSDKCPNIISISISDSISNNINNIENNGNKKKNTKNEDVEQCKIIFEEYNNQNIIHHKELKDDMVKIIKKALSKHSEEEILLAIKRYGEMYRSGYEYCNYKWNLKDFLTREKGISEFLDEGSKWNNYLQFKNNTLKANNVAPTSKLPEYKYYE